MAADHPWPPDHRVMFSRVSPGHTGVPVVGIAGLCQNHTSMPAPFATPNIQPQLSDASCSPVVVVWAAETGCRRAPGGRTAGKGESRGAASPPRGDHSINVFPRFRERSWPGRPSAEVTNLSLIHISEPTRPY